MHNIYKDDNIIKENADLTYNEVLDIIDSISNNEDTITLCGDGFSENKDFFINRLNKNMALGSDVTTYYAIKVDMNERDLYAKEINTYNAYNTRGPNMEGKLPVGPIASVSEESIKATLNPADGDYLYFVSDKNGDIYFSETYEKHQETIATLKKKGLWYEYSNKNSTDDE